MTSTDRRQSDNSSVDSFGNPLRPATNPNGTPYTGQLRYFSVFGPLLNTPSRPDCSDAVVQGAAWNPLRPGMDPAGISQKYLAVMPHANIFDGGDGLIRPSTSGYAALHDNAGLSALPPEPTPIRTASKSTRRSITTSMPATRSQPTTAMNGRMPTTFGIDHDDVAGRLHFGSHSAAASADGELHVHADAVAAQRSALRVSSERHGDLGAVGSDRTRRQRKVPLSMLLKGGAGIPDRIRSSSVQGSTAQTAMTRKQLQLLHQLRSEGQHHSSLGLRRHDQLDQGKHAFKGGVDFRFAYTRGSETPTAPIPKATGGAGLNPNQAFQNTTNFPGLVANNQTMANSLLYFLLGLRSTTRSSITSCKTPTT